METLARQCGLNRMYKESESCFSNIINWYFFYLLMSHVIGESRFILEQNLIFFMHQFCPIIPCCSRKVTTRQHWRLCRLIWHKRMLWILSECNIRKNPFISVNHLIFLVFIVVLTQLIHFHFEVSLFLVKNAY